MSVSFPASSGVPEQIFAFASSGARDSFMRALQEKSAALAAPGASVPVPVTAEGKTAAGGEASAEVTPPKPATMRLVSNTAARNANIARPKPCIASHIPSSPFGMMSLIVGMMILMMTVTPLLLILW
jgi:hypothetical protein